jgi:hypothetical protein
MNKLIQMVLNIKGKLRMVPSDMDMVSRYGLMVANMRDIGQMELLMVEASSIILTAMCMMVRYEYNNVYEGSWENDKANGYGIYYHSNGSRYEGQWLNDKQHGLGSEFWTDGSQYTGNYVNSKKQGRG